MMAEIKKLVIGTRGSKLALWQAEWVKGELERGNPGLSVELNIIKTTGDKILDVALAKVGGKGLFVKEIEEALLAGEADIAVHSMKDVPTDLPEGLHLKSICKREVPADALVTRDGRKFAQLPEGAHVGTSSLRRACQILALRPDIRISTLRGNLDTRLRKLDEGLFDAIVLAVAGMKRLGYAARITEELSPEVMLPAIGQGAVGIECRVADAEINRMVGELDHEETSFAVRAERALLKRLEGGCQVPIAAYGRLINGGLVLDGLVGSPSGDRVIKARLEGPPEEAESLGTRLAEVLLSKGAHGILCEVYGRQIPGVDKELET
jgi:hydroxymethylbilane synthase